MSLQRSRTQMVRCIAWRFRRPVNDELEPYSIAAEHRRLLIAYRHLGGLQPLHHPIGDWVPRRQHGLRFILGGWPALDH
jgi:hypothetical protein